ncbi:fluoride efflux transporter CrcB [Rhodovulum strictum]|uniref:Fluoride-specific ion channel FluC n=1 Tax=Rhodovulum strictum TaxID=58314 RepID=A0A844BID9_9RHOB|nr:fluoride efflux transporter CrcB [Rhodovulum strictum]MRH20733.1 fluoride efflux transporter CrcB [Rhodovulum strictum]
MAEALIALGLVALGGAVGSVARFWLSGVVARRFGETFPLGTLTVNVTGAVAIGVLAALLLAPGTHEIGNRTLWAGLAVGILGSYTTVSSFSLQTLALARNGETGRALANIVLSLALCLAAAAGGWLGTSHALTVWGVR